MRWEMCVLCGRVGAYQVVEEGGLARRLGAHDGDDGVVHPGALHARGVHEIGDAGGVELAIAVDNLQNVAHSGGCAQREAAIGAWRDGGSDLRPAS